MKFLLISLSGLSIFICFFIFTQKKTPQKIEIPTQKTCFSPENYKKIHNLITEKQTKKQPFFQYGGYDIYAQKENISFKVESFTLGRINLEKGIFSLAKNAQDNQRITTEIQKILCELVK